ncbi:hypothetical protein BEWA_029870 [Theileria equi strain WA]|uniref:Uncharacterized protein n=1 Tax=Theileria equi strain WA TaxID=1537102 RepID=L0AYP0_THEEQ|nr:hypothetical protein BEWA_029870 [Theileria equi strain WA]AFZ80136.1 hypothetical protein BEWA_029870 [Theileria equi strain WA]|eukprot:XP_004829802.1 hypothetical protein BEWA_029870 [Theileria equi strain WA]
MYGNQHSSRVVTLGSPFNITVMGYKLDEAMAAFLSLEPACGDANVTSKILLIKMALHPDLIYEKEEGNVAMWIGVQIFRRHYLDSLTSYERSVKEVFEMERTLYLCITDIQDTSDANPPIKNARYSGIKYLVSGPRVVDNEGLMTDGPRKFTMLVDRKMPVFSHKILIASFPGRVPPRLTCEGGLAGYSGSAVFQFHAFDDNVISWNVSSVSESSIICWCGRRRCVSLDDYSTTVQLPKGLAKAPNLGANSMFLALPITERISVALSGSVTGYDEIRLVGKNVKCGYAYSSKMTNNLNMDSHITTILPIGNGLSTKELVRRRNSLGSSVAFQRYHKWRSFDLSVRATRGEPFYKICHCQFLINESCQNDEDFGSLAGIVSPKISRTSGSFGNIRVRICNGGIFIMEGYSRNLLVKNIDC